MLWRNEHRRICGCERPRHRPSNRRCCDRHVAQSEGSLDSCVILEWGLRKPPSANRAKRSGGFTGYPSASPPTSRVAVGFHRLVAREPLLAASDLPHRASGRTAAGHRFSGRSSCRGTTAPTAPRASRGLRGLQRVSLTLVDICIAHPRSLTTGGVRYKKFSKAPIEKAGGSQGIRGWGPVPLPNAAARRRCSVPPTRWRRGLVRD